MYISIYIYTQIYPLEFDSALNALIVRNYYIPLGVHSATGTFPLKAPWMTGSAKRGQFESAPVTTFGCYFSAGV